MPYRHHEPPGFKLLDQCYPLPGLYNPQEGRWHVKLEPLFQEVKPGPLGRASLSDPVLPPEANQDDLHRQCVNSAPLMMGEALVFGHAESPHIELRGRPYMAVRFAVPASAQRLLSMKCRAGW